MITLRVTVAREYPQPMEVALGMIEGLDAWDIGRKAMTIAKRHPALRDIEPEEIKICIYAPASAEQRGLFDTIGAEAF